VDLLRTVVQLILDHSWEYAFLGFTPIILYLVLKRQAVFTPVNPGTGDSGCFDARVYTDINVFGGAAGFTFGWHYFLAAWMAWYFDYEQLSELFRTYGLLNLILSTIQVKLYFMQAGKTPTFNGLLKAHLDGCGWTTALSVLWPLFWLPRIFIIGWFFGWTILLRDLITVIDFSASWLPIKLVLSPITKLRYGKPTRPVIRRVDQRHKH
jgi:hypothetical protein